MRILLTGTDGQVGGALLPLLSSFGTVITPSLKQFDLSSPGQLAAKLDEMKPDIIINPAAYTAVDRAEDERDLAFRINAEGPAEIAQWAARRQVPLVHFSTDYVFDGSGSNPRAENSSTAPLGVYGASKLAGDTRIMEAKGPHLIFRTSWVYAAKGANFLRTIARLAGERQELSIVSDQIGAPTSAATIANAVTAILNNNKQDLPAFFAHRSGLVNCVCSGETSWHAFAEDIVSGLRARGVSLAVKNILPISTDAFPTKAKRPLNSRLSLERLSEIYGVKTPLWRDALEHELDKLAPELRSDK